MIHEHKNLHFSPDPHDFPIDNNSSIASLEASSESGWEVK